MFRLASQRVCLGFCLFVTTLTPLMIPSSASAYQGTPVANSEAWPTPPSTCDTTTPIDNRDLNIEMPSDGALVRPASVPNQDLYLVEVTLAPERCIAFDGHLRHDGAIAWYVQCGSVIFDIQPIVGMPVPDISLHRADGTVESFDLTTTLNQGDWLSVDRMVDYSYRNTDPLVNAIIMMTVLEQRPAYQGSLSGAAQLAGGCRGICKNPRR